MAPATKKLSRETLRRNGIIIEMEISEDDWPKDIAQVKDRILSFDCIIPPKAVARESLEPHVLTKLYKQLPQAKRDRWFKGEMACNRECLPGQNEAKNRHLENLTTAYTLYEHAVDWTHKGGMHEGKLGDKLADYVFEEWKKHADETSISSAYSRFGGEFATTFGRDTVSFSQAWHVRNYWHRQCSVAKPLHKSEKLSVPKPEWYFGFHIHNDIRPPRKTDKEQSYVAFSLTELNLLEKAEELHSCPLISPNKYCADIQKTPRLAKIHRRKLGSEDEVHSVGSGFEDSDSNELDEYEYTTTEDEDYEPGSEEEDDSSDSSDGNLEDDEDLDSETDEELAPSRGYRYKRSDVDVAEGGDTDGTDASDIETGTSRRKFEDYKLTCYPWAVVEVKKPGASPQDTEECYYQVANGSSACVALLRGLSDGPAHDYHHPVVAMTFVGRDARVFLTYAEPLNADHDDDDDGETIILYETTEKAPTYVQPLDSKQFPAGRRAGTFQDKPVTIGKQTRQSASATCIG
ncbi:hypothetical protein CNMCM8927_001608 [Aspergillus lentulus]|uniref:Uncharacterized protein n=1 Tax=Aspergillus lentulus TaxID=293939 RepID=A0AAN5YHU7_ASPLE|nr:hypothetical protein CNMCM8060_002072 [Aspergillus lentulus]KAF4178922.1 hypothetical protein CNMCM7927_002210 [Aspergillus lentulus]KAF4191881.1 hypothetical protein CNMCM8694_001156 [Aspergillus lentulus]KAF4201427.1 hypothetical protein CNMCM8927_001608 [Aspergillus lentulus]